MFRIPNLKTWVRDNRARQVQAALTIIQYWVCRGMPKGTRTKASFEGWAAIMSGIFDAINVRGFLQTPKDRRPDDPETEGVREMLLLWFNLARGKAWDVPVEILRTKWDEPVKAKQVARMIELARIGIDLGHGKAEHSVGAVLRRYHERVFEFETKTGAVIELRLRKRSMNGSNSWWIEAEKRGGETATAEGEDGLERGEKLPF